MKRVQFAALAIAASWMAAPVALADGEKKIVAITPFASPNDHNLGLMGKNAQPTFMTELVKSGKVRVVNEAQMKGAVKRFEREMTGLFDPKKAREIGKFLKCDYVVSGALSFTGDAFTMTVHVTNVETLELEMADDVDFREIDQMRVAIRTSAKKIAGIISGEGAGSSKTEAFLNIDARHFYDVAESTIEHLQGLDSWKYEGEVDSEDADSKQVHVKMKGGRPKPGMPLAVYEDGMGDNDKAIGVVYVEEPDEKGGGFIAKWIAEKNKKKKKKGDFGLGTRISNSRYRYYIAIGKIEDEAEDNAKLVDMFREKLNEKLKENKTFIAVTDKEAVMAAIEGDHKKAHKEGADFILEGKFIGSPGKRRVDFKLISAFTGESWGTLKFETRI